MDEQHVILKKQYPNNYTAISCMATSRTRETAVVLELAALRVRNGVVVESYSSYARSYKAVISPTIYKNTGITQTEIDNAPCLADVLNEFFEFLGEDPVVGHDKLYDTYVLNHQTVKIPYRLEDDNYTDVCWEALQQLDEIAAFYIHPINFDYLIKEYGLSTEYSGELAACYYTKAIYDMLYERGVDPKAHEQRLLDTMVVDSALPIYGKCITFDTYPDYYSLDFYKAVAEKYGSSFSQYLSPATDVVIKSQYHYVNNIICTAKDYKTRYDDIPRYIELYDSNVEHKIIYTSEEMFCEMLKLPHHRSVQKWELSREPQQKIKPKVTEIVPMVENIDPSNPLYNKVVVFSGSLRAFTKEQAWQIVANGGGTPSNNVTKKTNFLIVSNDEYADTAYKGKGTIKQCEAAEKNIHAGLDTQIISEEDFYAMIASYSKL